MATKFAKLTAIGSVGTGFYCYFLSKETSNGKCVTVKGNEKPTCNLPSRSDQLKSLQSEKFDVLIIGGGATGSGCALDAVTRGLKTALVEADDFASGTSSKSTKLIHGGARFLQKAITQLDYGLYKMMREALHERANMLHQAPYLARPLPIILPVYNWWQIPYYWFGTKLFDIIGGSQTINDSYFIPKEKILELFPMLNQEICGGIVYYDGQFDDARMNLVVALTAATYGATVVNHVSVTGVVKEKRGDKETISGVRVKDELTGKTWIVPVKCVINATGPFIDSVRKMDDATVEELCTPVCGVHVVLPSSYSHETIGLLDPATSSGKTIFFLPWQKHTIVGVADMQCEIRHNPKPSEDAVLSILEEVKKYLSENANVNTNHVLSAWCGIMPLVWDLKKPDKRSLVKNHVVQISPSGLVTIVGGRWTTYRAMAADTIDKAITAFCLRPKHPKCQTDGLQLIGAPNWTPTMYLRLAEDFNLEPEVAHHLVNFYGDRAIEVLNLTGTKGKRFPVTGKRIHPQFPHIEAEVRYGVYEYAVTAVDMVARRLRIAFLNAQAALEALPEIVEVMGEELHWSDDEKLEQSKRATDYIKNDMGHSVICANQDKASIDLSKEEMQLYIKRFEIIDNDCKGFVTIEDIWRSFKLSDEKDVSVDKFEEILRDVDKRKHGQVDLMDYLQIISAMKSGRI